jgi:hypothetical protein
MGAVSSTIAGPSGSASYSQMLKMTVRERELMERFFQTFTERITPKEMRELYSKTQCNKYVFLIGDALRKFFKAVPVYGPGAPVYFAKMEERKPAEHDDTFYNNCFRVAYFYIRMLQIFCALALTVSSKESMPYSAYGGAGGAGGAKKTYVALGPFITINDILADYITSDGTFKDASYLKYQKIDDDNGTIMIQKGDKVYVKAKIYRSQTQGSNQIAVELSIDGSITKRKTFEIVKDEYSSKYKVRVVRTTGEVLMDISKALMEYLQSLIPAGKKGEEVKGPAIQKEREELSVEYLVNRIKGSSSLPYASARALQLLELQPSYSIDGKTGKYTTHVFDYSYSPIIGNVPFTTSSDQLRKEYGTSTNNLSNVYGLNALQTLYYDDTENMRKDERQGDYRINPKNAEEYAAFIKTIYCMYKATSVVPMDKMPGRITGFTIENKEKERPGVRYLDMKADAKTVAFLKQKQAELFKYQAQHSARVVAFIRQYIINFGPDGFKLNDNFFKNGIGYINKVGEMARRMLLAYYVNCEHLYSQGHHAYKSGMAEPGPNILKECGAGLRQ